MAEQQPALRRVATSDVGTIPTLRADSRGAVADQAAAELVDGVGARGPGALARRLPPRAGPLARRRRGARPFTPQKSAGKYAVPNLVSAHAVRGVVVDDARRRVACSGNGGRCSSWGC